MALRSHCPRVKGHSPARLTWLRFSNPSTALSGPAITMKPQPLDSNYELSDR